jgi:hypothetical protein
MGFITKINGLSDVPAFDVEKEQLFDSRGKPVHGTFGIMRSDTREHFGTCREKYRPIQMDEMLDIVDQATDAIGGVDHIGYSIIGNGKRVLIQSKIDESKLPNNNNDPVDGLLYTLINNTGNSSNVLIPSTLRIACSNALHLISKGQAGTALRHSSVFDEKVTEFTGALQYNINRVVGFHNVSESLRKVKFTKDQMIHLVSTILPKNKKDKNPTNRLLAKREKIADLFANGKGNLGQTRWDALNAITEYESHQKQTAEKFVRGMSNNTLSAKALNILQAA